MAEARGWGEGGGSPRPFVRRRGRSPSASSPARPGAGREWPRAPAGEGEPERLQAPASLPARCHRWGRGWGALGPRSSGSRGRSERDGKRGKKWERAQGWPGEETAGRQRRFEPRRPGCQPRGPEEAKPGGGRGQEKRSGTRRLRALPAPSPEASAFKETGDALITCVRAERGQRAHGLN